MSVELELYRCSLKEKEVINVKEEFTKRTLTVVTGVSGILVYRSSVGFKGQRNRKYLCNSDCLKSR